MAATSGRGTDITEAITPSGDAWIFLPGPIPGIEQRGEERPRRMGVIEHDPGMKSLNLAHRDRARVGYWLAGEDPID